MFNLSAKKTFTLLCTLFVAIVLVGTSCKKDDEKTSKDLIVAHDWKLTAVKIEGIGFPLEDCDLDDIYTFNENGEYVEDEGDTKCFDDDPQSTTGSWSINESADPETITITIDGDAVVATIVEVSSSKFVVSSEDDFFGTTEITYEKI